MNDEDLKVCHVCNRRGVQSRCQGVYAHWRLGSTWDAYICFVVLSAFYLLREAEQLESADDGLKLV